jgi:hypothetical protein
VSYQFPDQRTRVEGMLELEFGECRFLLLLDNGDGKGLKLNANVPNEAANRIVRYAAQKVEAGNA